MQSRFRYCALLWRRLAQCALRHIAPVVRPAAVAALQRTAPAPLPIKANAAARSGGLVLMGFKVWPPCEQKIAPKKGADTSYPITFIFLTLHSL